MLKIRSTLSVPSPQIPFKFGDSVTHTPLQKYSNNIPWAWKPAFHTPSWSITTPYLLEGTGFGPPPWSWEIFLFCLAAPTYFPSKGLPSLFMSDILSIIPSRTWSYRRKNNKTKQSKKSGREVAYRPPLFSIIEHNPPLKEKIAQRPIWLFGTEKGKLREENYKQLPFSLLC